MQTPFVRFGIPWPVTPLRDGLHEALAVIRPDGLPRT
jgi:hypothetical protein